MNAIGTNRWVPVGSGCGRAMVSPRPGRRRLAAGGVRSTQAGGGEPRLSGPTPVIASTRTTAPNFEQWANCYLWDT